MSQAAAGYDIGLGVAAGAPAAGRLVTQLRALGVTAGVDDGSRWVAAASASTASLTLVADFLRREYGGGLVVDLTTPRPQVRVDAELPEGTLLLRWPDGREERRQGLGAQQAGYVVRTALATAGL